jgi:hypothetical protein
MTNLSNTAAIIIFIGIIVIGLQVTYDALSITRLTTSLRELSKNEWSLGRTTEGECR